MKKINKTPGPNLLTKFADSNPDDSWDTDFKNHNSGKDYQTIRDQILNDQGGLCAYCEIEIRNVPAHKQRVEHFHAKSDKNNPNINWGLDWNNLLGVCIGGDDADPTKYPLPANLSCDSYKNHLVTKRKLDQACEGYLLNPLQILCSPCLFDFDMRTGELKVNEEACKQITNDDISNKTVELIENTINILNLNCDRLKENRRRVLFQLEKDKKEMRTLNKSFSDFMSDKTKQWFSNKWPSFFTTRRILLGQHAEVYLKKIAYNG